MQPNTSPVLARDRQAKCERPQAILVIEPGGVRVVYTQHNVSKSDSSYIAGRVRSAYRLFHAFTVSILLLYSPTNAAFADAGSGHRSSSQFKAVQSRPRHTISPRHHAREPNRSSGSYRSELLGSKSEWKRSSAAQH
jgi:hypothetical protein